MTITRTLLTDIEPGVRMSLGMRDLISLDDNGERRGGLQCKVGPGTRRLVLVVELTSLDLYAVSLHRLVRGSLGTVEMLRHEHVHVEDLNRVLLDVERDGWGC